MKKKGMFVLPAVLLCGMALLGACSEDDTPLEGGGGGGEEVVPPGGEGGDVAMEGTGDVSQVKIGSQSAWWAETDERWLQLSLIGGSGGETVDVIAAYNTSPEARTGEVRVYQRGTAAPGAAGVWFLLIIAQQAAKVTTRRRSGGGFHILRRRASSSSRRGGV